MPYNAVISYVPVVDQSMLGVNETVYVPIWEGVFCSIAITLSCESVILKINWSSVTGETFPVAEITSLLEYVAFVAAIETLVWTVSGSAIWDFTFTIKSENLVKTKKLIKQNMKIRFKKLIIDKKVSKVSIIGVGMITTPGVTYRMFQTLANNGINILVISTSEIKISVLINNKNVKKANTALHKEFKLSN